MSQKPFDIFTTGDWHFLTQPKLEGQWFERKGHPPNRHPSGLKEFRQKIATPCVALQTVTLMSEDCSLSGWETAVSCMASIV